MVDSDKLSTICGSKVLIDISYVGTGFHGLAYQPDETNTVEGCLFDAFSRANIAANVLNNGYERCGRTDKDVHALHNYCSFYLDPCSPEGPCSSDTERSDGNRGCYRINGFVKAVNKHLPKSIRVNSIRCVPDSFSSRRNCVGRTYRYFFQLGKMDLAKMQEASQLFIGTHNFSQFCKVDQRNPKDPNTTLYSFTLEKYNELLHVATISGRAFLWHQVRCMVGVLFLVGSGAIGGSKIQEMLEHPEQPKYNYKMASPHGLVLVDCSYEMETGFRHKITSLVYQEELSNSIQRLGPLSMMAGNVTMS